MAPSEAVVIPLYCTILLLSVATHFTAGLGTHEHEYGREPAAQKV